MQKKHMQWVVTNVISQRKNSLFTEIWESGMETAVSARLSTGIGEEWQTSVGHHAIEALRAIGVLDAIIETSEGLIVYPKEMS
jgi:hypothetical protein